VFSKWVLCSADNYLIHCNTATLFCRSKTAGKDILCVLIIWYHCSVEYHKKSAWFEVFHGVPHEFKVFWGAMSCRLEIRYPRFGGTYRLRFKYRPRKLRPKRNTPSIIGDSTGAGKNRIEHKVDYKNYCSCFFQQIYTDLANWSIKDEEKLKYLCCGRTAIKNYIHGKINIRLNMESSWYRSGHIVACPIQKHKG
jgi:hypothetical protein